MRRLLAERGGTELAAAENGGAAVSRFGASSDTPDVLQREVKIVKNGDVIRAMDDEELADFLEERIPEDCKDCVACDVCKKTDTCEEAILRWLKMDDTND